MDRADELLIASLSAQAPQNGLEPIQNSGMEQVQETPAANAQEENAGSGMEQQQAGETQNQPLPEQPDYNKYVEEITGGQFKDVEAFKQALPRLTDYDTISKERDELKAKTEVNPFASDYVRILDELVRKGATPDQLNNFQKINAIGDISTLNPIDAKVAKLVLIDGYKESVARKMVERDYPIGDYDEGTDEKEILEEKLRVDANADKAALNQYKAETSTIKNPQEDLQLQTLAQRAQHESFVKGEVPKIASQITGMGEVSFKMKEGEPVKMKFDYPDDFKALIAPKLQEYFMDGNTPINTQTVAEAYKTINAAYLDENFPSVSQRIFDTAYAKAWEDATNKYENRSGLPQSPELQVTPNKNADYNKFLKGIVGQ